MINKLELIGVIITIVGLIVFAGSLIYGAWLIHPVFGGVIAGIALVATGKTLLDCINKY